MPSVDRPFSAIPRLPPWMDGPLIKRKAKEWGVSYGEAKEILHRKAQAKELRETNAVITKLPWKRKRLKHG